MGELMPWAIIWNIAPFTPQPQYWLRDPADHAAKPSTTNPMWLTEEYASSFLKSVCPMATNAPYTVLDGGTALATVAINQQQVPNDFSDAGAFWEDLGAGPYVITGSLLSPAGGLNFLINDRFAMQDATITRVDGASAAPIDAPRAVFSTRFVQTAAFA